MDDTSSKYALWVPAWHELDQPLALGVRERFSFFKTPPESYSQFGGDEFVFFNQLLTEGNCEVRVATIVSIEHPTLGPLQRIETEGLDYIFVRADGGEILVNAEEEPGVSYEPSLSATDWSVRVQLADVSEPVGDYV
jgi:hypothetical protein